MLGAVFGLSSCGSKLKYDNADKYTAGDWAQSVLISAIDVEWVNGKVEIVSHPYGYLAVSETSESELPEKMQMHWYYDGATLKIKPAADGVKVNKLPEKTLTVYVPGFYSFSDIDVTTVSADISIADAGANFVDIETVSGKVDLNLVGRTEEIEIETVSGDVVLSSHVLRSIEIASSSGRVEVNGKAVPAETEITTVSGDILYNLPESAAFSAECQSASGTVTNSFTGATGGGNQIVNGGTAPVELTTVSGNITIGKK